MQVNFLGVGSLIFTTAALNFLYQSLSYIVFGKSGVRTIHFSGGILWPALILCAYSLLNIILHKLTFRAFLVVVERFRFFEVFLSSDLAVCRADGASLRLRHSPRLVASLVAMSSHFICPYSVSFSCDSLACIRYAPSASSRPSPGPASQPFSLPSCTCPTAISRES